VKKRLALVGVGKWGANFLRAIVKSQQDALTLIVSSKTKEQLDVIAVSNAQVIPNISLIDSFVDEIDGVIVATPPEVRPAIVKKLLNLGVPVLAEKPLALNANMSVSLIRLATSLGVPLIEDYIHIYSWPYLLMREQLNGHWPISIESRAGNWGPFRDYSPLIDYAPHDLAMVLQIFNCAPTNIQLELLEVTGKLAFTAEIKLDFSELGQAKILISNIKRERVRQFELTQENERWSYDDNLSTKLTRNGISQKSSFTNQSSIQLLLDYFCGRSKFYELDKILWLSQTVAEVLQCLDAQYLSVIRKYH